MLGSLTVDRPQHSNGAGGGLLRRDLQQAINDSVVARAVAALGRRGAAIVGLIALLASAAQAASPAPPKLRMGTMTLSRCTGLPAPPAAY
jgi:hypothetical protein